MSTWYPYAKTLETGITIVSSRPGHAAGLEQLQNIVFPTLAPEERFRAEHYLKHIEIFPEGQFAALDGGRVVGMTSTIRLHFDFDHLDHTFSDVIQGGYLTSHEPDGPWMYGADIGTHPDYRGRGIARALYAARQFAARQLGLKGQVTVGMLSGYGARKHEMLIEAYYEKVVNGEIRDPTVSAQMRVGFEPRALIRDYLNDPVCDNCGALIVLRADKEV